MPAGTPQWQADDCHLGKRRINAHNFRVNGFRRKAHQPLGKARIPPPRSAEQPFDQGQFQKCSPNTHTGYKPAT